MDIFSAVPGSRPTCLTDVQDEFFEKGKYHGFDVCVWHPGPDPDEYRQALEHGAGFRLVLYYSSADLGETRAWDMFERLSEDGRRRVAVLAVALGDSDMPARVAGNRRDWLSLLRWVHAEVRSPTAGERFQDRVMRAAHGNPEMERILGLQSHEEVLRELAAIRLAALGLAGRPALALRSGDANDIWRTHKGWSEAERKAIAGLAQERIAVRLGVGRERRSG